MSLDRDELARTSAELHASFTGTSLTREQVAPDLGLTLGELADTLPLQHAGPALGRLLRNDPLQVLEDRSVARRLRVRRHHTLRGLGAPAGMLILVWFALLAFRPAPRPQRSRHRRSRTTGAGTSPPPADPADTRRQGAGGARLAVQEVPLQQRQERLHRCVVRGIRA